MTLDDVLQALRDRDAALAVASDGSFRCLGRTPLTPDDPLRRGIAEHRRMLVELFIYAPGGRCVEPGCYRLRALSADRCPDHLQTYDGNFSSGVA